jgi:Amiloride-sensitive sodium channel
LLVELLFYPLEADIDVEAREGLHFIVHPTDELPSDSSFHFRQKNHHTIVKVNPQQNLISDELISKSFAKRNCYLEHEKQLQLFKVYTKQNCEHECQSFAFAYQCGCVPFYLLSE